VPYRVELAAPAAKHLSELHPSLRAKFEQGTDLMRVRPYPWADSEFITEMTMYGQRFFAVLSSAFPYIILYRVFEPDSSGSDGLVVVLRLERTTP
jgi:hypothetical protein